MTDHLYSHILYGRVEEARQMLANGFDPNTMPKYETEKGQRRYIHLAAAEGQIGIIKELLKYGANVNTRNRFGGTPLHNAVTNNNLSVVKLLLASGADVNAQNDHYYTPLHNAMRYRCLDVITELLDAGADVTIKDRNGKTPFEAAGSKEAREIYLSYMDNLFDIKEPERE